MSADTRILWLPSSDYESRSAVFDYENNHFVGSNKNYAGVRVDSTTALQSTVVLACVRVLAESIASLPLHVYMRREDGGKVIAREHPLYRVLHTAPNSWQTSFEWREQQLLHLGTYGQSFSEVVRDSRDIVAELITLHPSRMRVERMVTGELRYLYQEEAGGLTTYSQDQVMHIRWLSDDGVNGIVPVELARDAIGLARACEIHGASFFGNGARPGVVLATDNVLSADAAENLRSNWERVHRGPDRASRTAVLQGGLKPMEIGSSNQESQFLETRRFQIEEICRLYRVPPHLVGDLTRSSFSNIEQQSIDFVQHTLVPWLRRFESAFSRDLLFDSETYFIEFDTRGLLRGDAAARGSYYSTLYNLGVASINEIRGWENLDPVEGGDLRFVGLSMQTLGEANAKVKAASEAPPASQPTADISGLTQVMQQVAAGTVSPEAAMSMMKAVFPSLPDAEAGKLLAGVKKTEEEQPAQAAEPEGPTEPQPTADVNGLLAVLGQVGAGAVTPEAALSIIRAVFPTMPEGLASAIVAGVQSQGPPPADPAASPPAEGAPAEAPPQAEEVEKKVGNANEENLVAPPESANNEERAAPDGVEVGDFVSWSTRGNRTRGRITRIVKDGVINVPKSDFNITGTPDNPAALIRLYREESGQWKPTDTLVAHKVSSLTKIDDLESRVFCSTGPGGGKDASCSPKDAGGGASIPDASDLTKVKSLGGSTGATLAQDKSGNSFVVKGGNSPEHIRSEVAANAVYEAAGVSVPRTKLDESDPSKPKQISEYVDAKPLASVKGAAREKAISEIQKGFAADALVANWDVVGLDQDNILVPKSGPPLRVDNGGSLTFRAQGKDKPFGPTVGELDSLRTSQQGKPIFGSLKDEDIASQIGDLSARRDKILAATPEPLRSTMSQRLDYMEKWAKGKSKRSQEQDAESRVFCSTGSGGGKDASCSPKDAGGGSPLSSGERETARAALDARFAGVREVPVSKLFTAKPGAAGRPVLMEPKKKDTEVQEVDLSKVVGSQETVPIAGLSAYIDGPPRDRRLPIVAEVHTYKYDDATGKSKPTGDPPTLHVVAGHTRLGVQILAGRPRAKVMIARYNMHRVPISEKDPSGYAKRSASQVTESRVFCATGPDGGKDPTCSPKDSGGGGARGSLKAISKSSMEVGKTYKITKLGKDYQGKATAVSHSADGKKTSITLALEGGGKKSLVLMSAAKVQEKMLAAAAQAGGSAASAASASAWKKDVEKLVNEKTKSDEKVNASAKKDPDPHATEIPGSSVDLPKGAPDGFDNKYADMSYKTKKAEEDKKTKEQQVLMSPTAKQAVKSYTSSAFAEMNSRLRDPQGKSKGDVKNRDEPLGLASAVARFKDNSLMAGKMVALSVATESVVRDKPIEVYRGAGSTLAKIITETPPGGTILDRGFGSTSKSYQVAAGGFSSGDPSVVMKIKTKWGLAVEGITSVGSEYEYIQPRNMRYRETAPRRWRKVGSRRVLFVELEALGPATSIHG